MEKTVTYPNERLQLNDYEAVMTLILDEFLRQLRTTFLPSGRTGGSAATSARIFSGFTATASPATAIVLSRGAGIFPFNDNGVLKFGVLLGEESPASYSIDVTGLGDGTYNVFARLVYSQASSENRVFWNASGTPGEYIDNVPTRNVPAWQYAIQADSVAPPGIGEYVLLWKATVATGAVTALTDYRHFFFEGDVNGTYAQEWGTGNDRNANRATYGAGDMHKFVQAVRSQLAEIIGDKWYTQRLVSLVNLAATHYGTADTDPGAHKSPLEIGAPGSTQWDLASSLLAGGHFLKLRAKDDANLPVTALTFASGQAALGVHPQGDNVSLAADDKEHFLWIGGPNDPKWIFKKLSGVTDGHQMAVVTLQTQPDITYRLGAGTVGTSLSNGIHLGNDAGYYLQDRTVTTPIALLPIHQAIDPWIKTGTGFSNNSILSNAITFHVYDLPHNAILNYLDIMWYQDSVASSGTDLRCYAVRHTIGFTSLGVVPLGGSELINTNLHLTQQYITAGGFGDIRNDRFTFNALAAARTFSRHYDRLAIQVSAPSAESKICSLYWIRLNFTYKLAQPFPTSGGAT